MVINFAHNVYDRPNMLKKTIELERKFYPDCNVFVAYNNKEIEKDLLALDNVFLTYFPEKTHKIGCVNGAYYAITAALNFDPDVIIFSHDDVYISDKDIVLNLMADIIEEGYDFIGRTPNNLPDIGQDYTMMEAMYFSTLGVKCIYNNFVPYKDEQLIDRDLRGSISPEALMNRLIRENLPEQGYKKLLYQHGNNPIEYNKIFNKTMGYTHENIGKRGWKE